LNLAEGRGQYQGPLVELAFWQSKFENLQNLDRQLQDEKITVVIKILEKTRSTYVDGFVGIKRDLAEGMLQFIPLFTFHNFTNLFLNYSHSRIRRSYKAHAASC